MGEGAITRPAPGADRGGRVYRGCTKEEAGGIIMADGLIQAMSCPPGASLPGAAREEQGSAGTTTHGRERETSAAHRTRREEHRGFVKEWAGAGSWRTTTEYGARPGPGPGPSGGPVDLRDARQRSGGGRCYVAGSR